MKEKISRKILVALPNDMLGGAEQFLKMVTTYYARMGHDVFVYFITKERFGGWNDLKDNEHVRLHFGVGNSEKKGTLHFLRNLYRNRHHQFDFTLTSHTHLTGTIGFLRRLGILKIHYFIGRESTSIFKRFSGARLMSFRLFYAIGYPALDLLICQTAFMKDQLIAGIPRITSGLNIRVLHNPINLEGISNQASVENMENSTSRYIVSAGRLIPEKGYDLLIKAYADILQEFPDTELLILGEGAQRPALQSLVDQLGLTDKVSMPGRVDNVYPYFKRAALCVVSSRVEGFPNVLLQMMSQNANVISTTCAGGINQIPGLPNCIPGDEMLLAQLMRESLKADAITKADRETQFRTYLEENSLENFMKKIDTYAGS